MTSRHLGGLIWTLVRTDFKVHYHGSVGGFIWAMMKPFSMFVVLIGVFSFIFTMEDDYALDLVVGLFLYNFFSEGTKTGLTSLYAKAYLLTKTSFPRWIVVVTSTANAIIQLVVFSLAVMAYLAWAGRFPSLAGIQLFVAYVLQLWLIVVGISLAMSVLYLRYRDLTHIWDLVAQAGFFAAPVVYPMEILPEWVHGYLHLWPPTPVIEFSRDVAIERELPALSAHLPLLGLTVGILAVGILVFRRYAPRAAEYV